MDFSAIYATGASLLWALVNISDQYLVSKYSTGKHTSGALVLFSSLIGLLVAIPIFVFAPHVWNISILDKLLLIITGATSAIWIIFYLYSMEVEDVSSVVPWFLTVPIFGYVLGFFFLGERLDPAQQFGSIVVLFGLVLLSIDFSKSIKFKIKKEVILYMFLACLLIAAQGIVFKYITVVENFWVSSFWEYIGLGIAGVLFFVFVPSYRVDFFSMLKRGGGKITLLNLSSEVVGVAGNLLARFALLISPVTIVYLLTSFQPAFVLLFTVIGTYLFPNIVKEDTSAKVLVPKIIAILIMIGGSAFLFK